MRKKISQTKTQTLKPPDTARCNGTRCIRLSLGGCNGKKEEGL